MTTNALHRTADPALAELGGNGRTVFGRLVPYGETVTVDDGFGPFRERFAPGAFARSIRERGEKIRLFRVHDASRSLPIGRAVDLREMPDGLHGAFQLADTRDADDALALVKDGTVDSFSIAFRPIRDRQEGDVTVRTEAALIECSLVGIPAYSGATVAGVRSTSSPVLSVDVARRRLDLLLKSW